jgi:uncharacterized Zn finger protein
MGVEQAMGLSTTWWARRWEQLRQEFGVGTPDAAARAARVRRLEVLAGEISAVVQDRDAGACTISFKVATLRNEQWESVTEQLSKLAMVNAQILSGAMPPEIEQVFTEAGTCLVASASEVTATCSCCSPAPCRHLPQILNLFAEMLSDDPGLLFTLRGRDRQQILRDVREARTNGAASGTGSAVDEAAPVASGDGAAETVGHLFGGAHVHDHSPGPAADEDELSADLAQQIDQYWGNRKLLKQFHYHIAPPIVELSLLRRLGPINTSDEAMALYEQMVAIYRKITDDALALAYAADEPDTVGSNGSGNGSANNGSANNGSANNGSANNGSANNGSASNGGSGSGGANGASSSPKSTASQ